MSSGGKTLRPAGALYEEYAVTMQTMWKTALVGAAMMGSVAVAPAGAQTIDFRTTSGGFTSQSIQGTTNPWTYTAGTGWTVDGVTSVSRQRLLSTVLTASGGAFAVGLTHAFNLEQSSTSSVCYDGGAVFASINGGAFAQLVPSSGQGYVGVVSPNFGNPLAGLPAFCGGSGGLVSSMFSGTLAAGTTVQLAFDGAWDSSVRAGSPNWSVQQVSLSGFGTQVVPEPSTYVLLASGLGGLGMVARRRRRGV